jgi:S-adenosylmethionine:tRNA ribosyltransferase-isomerase
MEPIDIRRYRYDLPEERIAKFPLTERDASKLLVYRTGKISEKIFREIGDVIPDGSLLVFNNTKVVRARLQFFKATGARIEIFCLEPRDPYNYERAFSQKGRCVWQCVVGNLKKWKDGPLQIPFPYDGCEYFLTAERLETATDTPENGKKSDPLIRFTWTADLTFGQLLELLGTIPVPPYLRRESEASDNERYQTVYSRWEGSVAAPTAGLHFTPALIDRLRAQGIATTEVTLHVGAGTFLPVKADDATQHPMHTEYFSVEVDTLPQLIEKSGNIIAVGTTSVRTLESMAVLGYRVLTTGDPRPEIPVGQWEPYDIPPTFTGRELLTALLDWMEERGLEILKTATRIMIAPRGYTFRVVSALVTNFHQPRSTLLLLIAALVGDDWQRVYEYALSNNFRFLSYGDSSILFPGK